MAKKNLTRATKTLLRLRWAGWCAPTAVTLLVCLATDPLPAQGNTPKTVELTVGQPQQQTLGAEDEWRLAFDAGGGGTYILEIEQGGLDLVATVVAPDGSSQTYDSPLLRDESELIVLDAPSDGRFLIRIASDEYTGAKARLSVSIAGAADVEPSRMEAMRLAAAASAANHSGTMDGWNEALAAFEAMLSIIPPSSSDRLAARGLFSMATIEYWQMGRWRRAAELAGEASAIYASTGLPRLAASASQLRAAALIEETTEIEKAADGEIAAEALVLFEQAEKLLRQARDAQLQLPAPYDAALSANYLGMTFYYMGDWQRATPWFREAAMEHRAIDEWSGELQSLGNLAVVDFERGSLLSAIDSFERILDILPADRSLRYRADTLDNLAASQLALGRLEDALRNFSEALEIHKAIDDQKGRGRALAGIGVSYSSIGEQELALEHLQAALSIRRAANDGRGQVSVLNFLGNIHRQRGQLAQAVEAHTDARRLATAPIDQARAQIYLALDLISAGNPSAARSTLTEVQQIAEHTGNRKLMADSSRVSGDALMDLGEPDSALRAYREALEAYRALTLRAEEVQAIFGVARALRAQGRQEPAYHEAAAAIALVETLRAELVDPELRGFFLSLRQDYYDFLIDTAMDLHEAGDNPQYLRQALETSERSRARALVDLVTESSLSRYQTSIEDPSRQLYQRMAELRYRLNRALEEQPAGDSESSLAAMHQEMAYLENALHLLRIRRREEDPALANLTDPEILSAERIQEALDRQTVLLHYNLGPTRSYVWKVTSDAIVAWRLPPREVINELAGTLFGLLKTPAHTAAHREALARSVERVSDTVLRPLGELNGDTVIVVADGGLQYLPFSLLKHAGGEDPLLANHEVINVPSMSTLVAQRAGATGTARPAGTIAIFADPVFDAADSRLANMQEIPGGRPAGKPSGDRTTPLRFADLVRLPATLLEARAIADLAPPEGTLLAVGFDANKDTVLQSDLGRYRYVHFATHGLIDSRYPALSSLVLSQFDDRGQPRDGYLRLYDIYGLQLSADLVTLSACDTALGREISGEGLTGLTQALMYSGSRSVLASLWQVPDRATAELMRRMYRYIMRFGQRPAAALRNAQLELSAEAQWRGPYFWSAFVLQGEWR